MGNITEGQDMENDANDVEFKIEKRIWNCV